MKPHISSLSRGLGRFFLAGLLGGWLSPLLAQPEAESGSREVSLEALITEVVAWNAELVNQRLSVQIGEINEEGESYFYEPEFFATVSFRDTDTPNNANETISRAGLTSYLEERWDIRAGVTGLLAPGTEWRVEYSQSEAANSVIDSLRAYTREYESQVKATLRQPLLRGFGRDVTLADLDNAELEADIARAAYKEQLMEVIAFTIREYAKLYGAQVLVTSLEESVARLEESAALVEERFRQGDIPQSGVFEVRSSLLEREIELRSIRNSLSSIEGQIFRILNGSDLVSPGQRILASEPDPRGDGTFTGLTDYVEYALFNRALFQIARARIEQAEITERRLRNEAKPQLDVFGSAWVSNLDDDWIGHGIGSDEFASWEAGVSLRMPLMGNRKARSDRQRASIELQQSRNEFLALQRDIAIDLRDAIEMRDTARTQLADMRTAYGLKEQLLEANLQRFRAGDLSIDQLVEEEDEATQYYRRLVNKIIETTISQANLDRSSGFLLEKYGIDFEAMLVAADESRFEDRDGDDFDSSSTDEGVVE